MGNVTGRSEPEVHVVLVQSKENRQVGLAEDYFLHKKNLIL